MGFEGQNLDQIKMVLAGVDDTITRYPAARPGIMTIKFDPKLKAYGKMNEYGTMTISPKGLKTNQYRTGIHETIHALDYELSDMGAYSFSDGVMKDVRKNLKLRANSKDYINQATQVMGMGYAKYGKLDHEVMAWLLEGELGYGKSNQLSKEILKVLEERMK